MNDIDPLQESVLIELKRLRRAGLARLHSKNDVTTPLLDRAATAVLGYSSNLTRSANLKNLLLRQTKMVKTKAYRDWLDALFNLTDEYDETNPMKLREIAAELADQDVENFRRTGGNQDHALSALAAQIITGCLRPRNEYRGATSSLNFAIRDSELIKLEDALVQTGKESGVVVITGPGGAGKTMLAEHWANRVSQLGNDDQDQMDDNEFPKRPIIIRLDGNSIGQATSPIGGLEQLRSYCRVKGSTPTDHHAAAYEFGLLAAEQHSIIILDDARNADHVQPLLPATDRPYFALVTTRDETPNFGASHPLTVVRCGRLDADASLTLLQHFLIEDLQGDRLSHGREIVKHTAGLPLAIWIAACIVNAGRETLASLAGELSVEQAPLDTLDTGRDELRSLRSIFRSSYVRLAPEHQRVFRLLGLRLGRGVDIYAVSLLSGDKRTPRQAVAALEQAGLVEPEAGRFDVHDLLHAYARECLEKEDRVSDPSTVLDRLLYGYYGCVNYVFDKKNPENPMIDYEFLRSWESEDRGGKESIDRYEDAQTWFLDERANLVDLVLRACKLEPPMPLGPRLAFSLFYSLERGGFSSDWEAVTEAGLRAAEQLDDPEIHALLLRNQARIAMVRIRDWQDRLRSNGAFHADPDKEHMRELCTDVLEEFEKSAALYQRCSSSRTGPLPTIKREMADTYMLLARFDRSQESLSRAEQAYAEAKGIFESAEGSVNPIASLNVSLSVVHRIAGEVSGNESYFEKAEDCLAHALAYAYPGLSNGTNEVTHPSVAAHGLQRSAELALACAEREHAAELYDHAIKVFRTERDWLGEARALATRGHVFRDVIGDEIASASLERAKDLLVQHGAPESEVVSAWLAAMAN